MTYPCWAASSSALVLRSSAAGTDEDDFRAEFGRGFALDRGRVVGHDDDRLHFERAGGVGHALGVIAAGVGDDAALAFVFRERSDLVVGSAEFEGADGLLVFGLEKKMARVVGAEWKLDQLRADGDALEAAWAAWRSARVIIRSIVSTGQGIVYGCFPPLISRGLL